MMKKKIFLFIFPILAVTLFFALSANATLIESGLPGGGPDSTGLKPGNSKDIITPAQYVRYLYLFVMGFVGIAGLVTLVIWGTVWTASGVVDKKAAAMEGIKNTLYGIGIALSAYLLLFTINPDLTVIRTPSLKVDTSIKPSTGPTGCISGVSATKCQWVNEAVSCTVISGTTEEAPGSWLEATKPNVSSITYKCCKTP